MMKNSLKKNNKGVSLVEIIIVVAIMTIVGATVVLSTRVATDKHVNSCALKLASSLEQTRNLALGKQGAYLTISQNTNDYVYVQMYVDGNPYGEAVAIGRPGISISVRHAVYDSSLATENKFVSSGTGVPIGYPGKRINFDRSSGSASDPADPYNGVFDFTVTNGSREYDVYLDTFTGRVDTYLTTQ